MRSEDVPPLGDYDGDGIPEAFCSECNYGWERHILGNFNVFSKNKVKKTVDLIFVRNDLDFDAKKPLLNELFDKCNSYDSVIKFLKEKTGESLSFLTEYLY